MTDHRGFLCPACAVVLVISERQGIEIDYCPKCRGVWLDRGELDKIIARSAEENDKKSEEGISRRDFEHERTFNDESYGHGGHGSRRRRGFLRDLFD